MEPLFDFIAEHDTAFNGMVIGYIASAAVQALPEPDTDNGKFYRFVYKFAHTMAANIRHVMEQNKRDKEHGTSGVQRS